MATYSSVLAWRTPEMGEPGELPSRVTQSRTRLKRLSSSSSSVYLKVVKMVNSIFYVFCYNKITNK